MIEKKCYVFQCMNYPKCENAAGSVCALPFDQDEASEYAILAADCYEREDKPFFVQKDMRRY